MNWMKWTSELVLAAMVITVPVAMLVVLLPGVALVRLLERLGVLEPEVISPMPGAGASGVRRGVGGGVASVEADEETGG